MRKAFEICESFVGKERASEGAQSNAARRMWGFTKDIFRIEEAQNLISWKQEDTDEE